MPQFSTFVDPAHDPLAWQKGPQWTTLKFSTEAGAVYEYIIENQTDVDPTDTKLLRQMENLSLQSERAEVQQWRQRCGFHVYDQPPTPKTSRVVVNLEIVSARDFAGEQLYMEYEVVLPATGWRVDPTLLAPQQKLMECGVTQTSRTRRSLDGASQIAHFSFPIELNLLQSMEASSGSLLLLLHVFLRDRWERVRVEGYATLPLPQDPGFYELEARSWRPKPRMMDQIQDFFVGGANQLLDVPRVAQAPNKFGFSTVSSGSVQLRVHVLHQYKVEQQQAKPKKRAVLDILSNLKESRLRREAPPKEVSDLLSTLKMKRLERQKRREEAKESL